MATRGFKPEITQKNEKFVRSVRAAMEREGVSRAKLARVTGLCTTTISIRFSKNNPNPDPMTIQELRIISKVLKLSDQDILDFVRG